MDNGSWPDNHNSWKCKDVAVSKTSLRRFILSSGTRFSSFALTVFKWHEGKVGQFNTIQIGQALSYHTDDIILIPWQKKTAKDFCLKILFLIEAIRHYIIKCNEI